MTPEEALALKEVAYKLIGIATGEPGAELPIDHPPGTVPVKPTGVLGAGKVRYWPQPIEVPRIDGTRGMELCYSYALRLSYVARPDGEMYVPAIFRQGIGEWMIKVAPGPEQSHLYAATVDRWIYPEDWMTQAEIDARLVGDQQWAESYRQKFGV